MESESTIQESPTKSNAFLNFIKSSSWSIPFIALIILTIAFSLRLINNADIGFHLKGGQWIIDNLQFPGKDVFTFTSNAHDYIDMQWLYQVIIFLIQTVFGYSGLTIFNVLLILTSFYMLYRIMRVREIPLSLIVVSLFLILLTIQIRFSYRPELMSWIGILLTIFIMEVYFFTKKRNLYLLPIITLIWVNMHGLFIIGLFVMAVYLLSVSIKDKKVDIYFLKWFGISVAATLINPYFITGATYPFYLLTRLDESNIFAQTIHELQSPFSMEPGGFGLELNLYFYTAFAAFVLMLITIRKREIHEYIIFAAFFYISFAAFRNIPIVMFYAGFMIALSLKDIGEFESVKRMTAKLGTVSKILAYGSAVIFILFSARVITGNYYIEYGAGVDFGVGLNEKSFPVKAVEYMKQNNFSGKVFNDIGYGGWLEWSFPGPVYIDGRLEVIKEDLYKEYLSSFGESQLAPLISKYEPRFVVLDHGSAYEWVNQMNGLTDYRLAYIDENTVVFGKKDFLQRTPINKVVEVFPNNGFRIDFNDEDIKRILAIKPGLDGSDWFKGFYQSYPQYRDMMNFALMGIAINKLKETEYSYLNILEKTNGKLDPSLLRDIYFNLGTIYQMNNKMDYAMTCYRTYLEIDPTNNDIRARLTSLENQQN